MAGRLGGPCRQYLCAELLLRPLKQNLIIVFCAPPHKTKPSTIIAELPKPSFEAQSIGFAGRG